MEVADAVMLARYTREAELIVATTSGKVCIKVKIGPTGIMLSVLRPY